MCHIVLAMPILTLPIFWLLPPNVATPIYAIIVLLSGLLYWQITRAMRRPVATGTESLLGTRAEVVSKSGLQAYPKYLVRAGGELWSASGTAGLLPGQIVKVVAVEGVKLVIGPAGSEPEETGRSMNERHHH